MSEVIHEITLKLIIQYILLTTIFCMNISNPQHISTPGFYQNLPSMPSALLLLSNSIQYSHRVGLSFC